LFSLAPEFQPPSLPFAFIPAFDELTCLLNLCCNYYIRVATIKKDPVQVSREQLAAAARAARKEIGLPVATSPKKPAAVGLSLLKVLRVGSKGLGVLKTAQCNLFAS
jgi:hypothetical protein